MIGRLKSALNKLDEEGGMILPTVFVLLLMLAILIPPMIDLVGTGVVSGEMYEDKSHELYAADAGVQDALWLLAGTSYEDIIVLMESDGDGLPNTYTYELPDPVNNITVRVELTIDPSEDDTSTILSTATRSNGSSTTIEAWAAEPYEVPTVTFSTGAMNGDVTIKSDLGTEESPVNFYANGNIDIGGSAVVYGDGYLTRGHEITVGSNATHIGTSHTTRPMQVASDFVPEKPIDIINHSVNITGERTLGNVYIRGDLSFVGGANLTLTGDIWVSGDIKSPSENTIIQDDTPDDEFYFLVSESVSGTAINFNGGYIEAILYAPNSSIYIAGGAYLAGAALAGYDVDITGSSFLINAIPFEPCPIGLYPMVVQYWKIY